MCKALQLSPLIYPDETDPSSFKTGTGWLKRFKDRHGVRALSIQRELQSAATTSDNPFKENLQKIIEEKGLIMNQVFNCDETGMYWKIMPNNHLFHPSKKKLKVSRRQKIVLYSWHVQMQVDRLSFLLCSFTNHSTHGA